jgi:hypothetical protein
MKKQYFGLVGHFYDLKLIKVIDTLYIEGFHSHFDITHHSLS